VRRVVSANAADIFAVQVTIDPADSSVRGLLDDTPRTANPIVMFIMRLLATTSVADDRITFTSRTSPQNNLGATLGPIRFEVVRRCGKWDKQNRTSLELCPGLTCQDLSRKRILLKQKSNWKRITLLACSFYGRDSEYWPVIIDHPEVIGFRRVSRAR
jgi:hypothetical protein